MAFETHRIRRAVLRDLDQIAALWTVLAEHHAAIDSLFAAKNDAEDGIRQLLQQLFRAPDAALFVCEGSAGLSGFCAVRIDRAPMILMEAERAEITDLLVREAERRRGAGRALVDAALAWVADRGIARCEVRVAARNAEGQGFWRSMDFDDLMDVLHRRL